MDTWSYWQRQGLCGYRWCYFVWTVNLWALLWFEMKEHRLLFVVLDRGHLGCRGDVSNNVVPLTHSVWRGDVKNYVVPSMQFRVKGRCKHSVILWSTISPMSIRAYYSLYFSYPILTDPVSTAVQLHCCHTSVKISPWENGDQWNQYLTKFSSDIFTPLLPVAQFYLDLDDPNTLGQLSHAWEDQGVAVELFGNQDSYIEDDDEPVLRRDTSTLPVHRQPLTPSEDSEDENDIEAEINSPPAENGSWNIGASMPKQLIFTGDSGLMVQPNDTSLFGILDLMIDEDMMSSTVDKTNCYVAASLRGKALSPKLRLKNWVDVTIPEMKAFFGLIIAMGLVAVDDLQEYWSTHPISDLPFFRSIMKRDRFLLILLFLHLSNNEKQPWPWSTL